MPFDLKDSGERESYKTGAVRDPETGKGRYDLISTHATRRLAVHMEKGAGKYGDRNWEKGLPASRCLSSAKRHIDQRLEGCTDEDHLAAAVFNLNAVMHIEAVGPEEMLDLPNESEHSDKIEHSDEGCHLCHPTHLESGSNDNTWACFKAAFDFLLLLGAAGLLGVAVRWGESYEVLIPLGLIAFQSARLVYHQVKTMREERI